VYRRWRYFSGRDEQRLAELDAAWRDQNVDALFYVGAGWGSARVLEAGFRFGSRPLWALGFSNCSALLFAQCAAGFGGPIHGSLGGPDEQCRPGGCAAQQGCGLVWVPNRCS